jgi:hypothetical protein
MSKLADALRKKYGTPRAVLQALGLDESILADARAEAARLAQDAARARDSEDVVWHGDHPTLRDPAVEEGERIARAKDAGQITGAEIEKILRTLREAGVASDTIKRISYALSDGATDDLTESNREQLREREKPTLDDIADFLRSKNLSEDDVKKALELGAADRRRAAKDTIPRSGVSGGFGGAFSERGMAGDRAIAMDRLAKKFPGIERITVDSGFGVRPQEPERNPAPSRAQLERLHSRFPGMAAIKIGG